MKVQSIHMTEFKRFSDLTIDLGNSPKRIVALIGPNGCGKSSVFDAFVVKQSQYFGNKGDNVGTDFYLQMGAAVPSWQNKQIDVVFENNKSWNEVVLNDYKRANGLATFIFRSSYRYNTNVRVKSIQAVKSIETDPKGVDSSSSTDERLEFNYRQLLTLYYDLLEEEENITSAEAKQRIIGDLNQSLNTCLGLEIVSLGNVGKDKGCLFLTKPDYPEGREFSQNVLSAGEKEVLDLLLDLYLRKEHCKDVVYLIDEPELHINTSIQRNLLKAIVDLVPPHNQIWIATHSIGIMRSLQTDFADDCQIIEFKPEMQWASSKITLTPTVPTFRDWQRLFTTALADLTHLTLPNKVVLCEGRLYDYQVEEKEGLDGQIFNNIFGEMHPDTVFISIGGCADIDKYHSDLKKMLSQVLLNYNEVTLLSLTDRDDKFENGDNAEHQGNGSNKGLDKRGKDQVCSYLKTLTELSDSGFQEQGDLQKFATTLKRLDKTVNNALQTCISLHKKTLSRRELENYLCDPEVLQDFAASIDVDFDHQKYDELLVSYVVGAKSTDNEQSTPNLAPIYRAQIKDNMGEIFSACFVELSSSKFASADADENIPFGLLKELQAQVAASDDKKLKKWINWNQFKLLLSNHIKPGIAVYDELEQCIFGENTESQK